MLLVTEWLEAKPDLSLAGDRKFPAFQLSFPVLFFFFFFIPPPGSHCEESYFKEPFNIIAIFWVIIWTLVTFKYCTTTVDFRELSLPNFSEMCNDWCLASFMECTYTRRNRKRMCLCGVCPPHYYSWLMFHLVRALLNRKQHSHSVEVLWGFVVQESGDRGSWKGRAPNQMWGTSSVEGEQSQKPEYQVDVCGWIILVYISWLTLHKVHVLPPTFPSAFAEVKHIRQSADIASKGECRKRTLDPTFFHSCL